MATKIFVDTNVLKNESSKNKYLGHRDELDALAKHGDLMLPKVVIDELEIQKNKCLKSDRASFVANQFFKHAGINQTTMDAVNDDAIVTALREGEDLHYTVVDLVDRNGICDKSSLTVHRDALNSTVDRGLERLKMQNRISENERSMLRRIIRRF
jgi:rRNA-processing protein FCF1